MCKGTWDCVGEQDLRGDKQKYCIHYSTRVHKQPQYCCAFVPLIKAADDEVEWPNTVQLVC